MSSEGLDGGKRKTRSGKIYAQFDLVRLQAQSTKPKKRARSTEEEIPDGSPATKRHESGKEREIHKHTDELKRVQNFDEVGSRRLNDIHETQPQDIDEYNKQCLIEYNNRYTTKIEKSFHYTDTQKYPCIDLYTYPKGSNEFCYRSVIFAKKDDSSIVFVRKLTRKRLRDDETFFSHDPAIFDEGIEQ